MRSFRFELDGTDYLKITKGALIAAGGCIIAFATEYVGLIDESTTYGAIIAAIGSTAINIFRKWVVDNGGIVKR